MPGAEIMIADGNGAPSPPGVAGHIKGRIGQRWHAPAAKHERPWIDVGDLGWMTVDGELFVSGRVSDTSSGYAQNAAAEAISPVHEIEHLLRLEWDAADAAAVMIDVAGDVEGGAAPPAIWIATVDCKDADASGCAALLRARGFAFPVRLFALKSIPRGANGKVQRTQLKSLLQAAAAKSPSA
jgi:acyl-CoA synthetase (AMP-forming)/AMP-acid ligase II